MLTSLSGLDSLVSIGGYLYIRLSDVLIDLKGLSSLTSIGSHLYLESNILLTDLSGLDSLTFIGGSIDFRYNSSLETLSGLNSISSLGQHLVLRDNLALSSLSDLAGLTSVGGDVEITLNHSLENLNGLENIAAATINNLSINNNNSLSSCEVQSVCNYLSSPNGTINIDGNASGCLNQAEVEQACGISSISDFLESPFGIYPNPTKNIIFISNKSGLYISEISIFDHSGRQVLHTNKEALEINVSMLSAGMYTISIVSDERIIKTKFIVE